VTGYAFFVGGGRAAEAETILRDADGRELSRARTDGRGAFRFTPPAGVDVVIVVNAGDGHVADAPVAGERFMGEPARAADAPAPQDEFAPRAAAEADAPRLAPADLAQIERRVEEAVARQMRPLLEAQAQERARLRFNDVIGGIGMIAGVFAALFWAMTRRRRQP